jgi:hypothetical protein
MRGHIPDDGTHAHRSGESDRHGDLGSDSRIGSEEEERLVRRGIAVLGAVLGVVLIVRAIAEPFVIDMSDSATYRDDWGGPSLAGVLAVHMLPGLIAAAVFVWAVTRRRSRGSAR